VQTTETQPSSSAASTPTSPPSTLTSLYFLATSVSILLLIAFLCLVITIGLRRARRRRAGVERPPAKTVYVDAWAEAGKRATGDPLRTPDPNQETRTGLARPGGAIGSRPVALVTGGARRVGLAIANALARAGCDVVITYRSSEAEALAAVELFKSHGVSASAVPVDFADTESVQTFARGLAAQLPRLDVLVHNASLYEPSELEGPIEMEAQRHWRVNALAPLVLTAAFKDLLAASPLTGGGSVVAMLDIHALGRPRKGFAAYAMSKASLAEMVHSLARDLAPDVRVNGVAPGVVAWPESGHESDESSQKKYVRRIPLGRSGTPDEAAEVVRWLALDATYVTGEIIRIDGGRWLT